jgi:holliday junction DNA helicase RuvA
MIASLKGKINRVGNNFVEVEVLGVGYLVKVGNGFLRRHKEGEEVTVRTYMAVSENDMSLYGFENQDEVELFKLLLTVSGVGPKTGCMIMGDMGVIEIMKAIGEADVNFFQKIKGVGKKTAQRIIVDLKSKIGGLGELDLSGGGPLLEDDLYLSLKQLGFDRKEIDKVTKRIPKDMESLEEKLGWCLKEMA